MITETVDKAYTERAQVVVALARLARSMGYSVGFGYDAHEPAWPVLFIEVPKIGQMSWHLSQGDRCALAPDIQDDPSWVWDGHSTSQKYERLAQWSISQRG